MKRRVISILFVAGICAACSLLTGCRKQCACLHNSGTIVYFSKSEVEDSNGGSCANMKYQSDQEYFVGCEWE